MLEGQEAVLTTTLQERIFNTKIDLLYKLQELGFQTESLKAYRNELVKGLVNQIQALPRDHFSVKQHLRIIDKFQTEDAFSLLTYENTLQIAEHIAPLILPAIDDIAAVRFDQLVYQIELAILAGKSSKRAKNDLLRKAKELSALATIPAIAQQKELLEQILYNDHLDRAGIEDFEVIRQNLRGLMKYIPESDRARYDTNFTDDILAIDWRESELDNEDLANYKKKVSFYILQHQSIPAIAKLKGNLPLTPEDVQALEHILWDELGTKDQYASQYGDTSLGELVRSIVGVGSKGRKCSVFRVHEP